MTTFGKKFQLRGKPQPSDPDFIFY